MSIKDGGPLHPFQPLDSQGMPCMAAEPGISIRDHFAGCALIGSMATAKGLGDLAKSDRTELLDTAAGLLYEIADAMIRAREASQ